MAVSVYDVTYGNVPADEAQRLGVAALRPCWSTHHRAHQPGDTEPWVSRLVGDLIVARGAHAVLETGCFTGATTMYILDALRRLGGGHFVGCEIDPERRTRLQERFNPNELWLPSEVPSTMTFVGDVMEYLQSTNMTFDVAWVDDDHTKLHVLQELKLLFTKMNPRGIILLHDVYGSCDLQDVVRLYGGYALDFPRLGPAGGLGLIQVPF